MSIHVIGDDLLHVGSPTECTGFAATHTGWIEMRVVIRAEPPADVSPDWDAASETTLWCPRGILSVSSMMGSTTEELVDLPVRAGLVRVRVQARNRIHESVRTEHDPPEQHEPVVWPVTEDVGSRTLLSDGARGPWEQRTAAAAEYAMLDVIRPYDTHEERDPDLPRVTVVRRRSVPWSGAVRPGRLPVGDREVHLTRTAGDTLEWRWASATAELPDEEPSTVRIEAAAGAFTVRHEGVPGRLAAQQEAQSWGGTPPTERLRHLSGDARMLSRLDRPLLDRLAGLPAERQREIAVWAARRAMRVAGLEPIGWIAAALVAVEAGGRLPVALTEDSGQSGSRRLFDDPAIPRTVITLPGGPANFLQQSVAYPALLALAHEDPLAAAVDAVHTAAVAHGEDGWAGFLADVPVDPA